MSYWKPEPWTPSFSILPRVGVDGRFVWGKCERRKLTNRYEDGYDHLRRIHTIWQVRAALATPAPERT